MAPSRSLALIFFTLAGCAVGPDYVRPTDDIPSSWSKQNHGDETLATTPWWRSFGDPVLDRIIDKARRANPDVLRAAAAVDEARALVDQAKSGFSPRLNADVTGAIGRQFTPPSYYSSVRYGTAGFDASWELDLWGKVRRGVEATKANAEGAQANADDAVLIMLGDVTRNYIELRGAQAQLAAIQGSISIQRDGLKLVQAKKALGDGSDLEVLQAKSGQVQAEAQVPPTEAQIRVSVHVLSVLCGEPPEALASELSGASPVPQGPDPGLGVPADLIRRRPDVRQAERQLAGAVAKIGVAVASRYPSVRLSGNLSLSGSSVAQAMTMPIFALTPSISLPLFDGGMASSQVDIQKAQAEQARIAYRAAVLKALQEVEDAMARLHGETQHQQKLAQAVQVAQKQVDLSKKFYAIAGTDFLQVLDAERTLDSSRLALVQSEVSRAVSLVALYKSLGGGWSAL